MNNWIRGRSRAPKEEGMQFLYAVHSHGEWFINIGRVYNGLPEDAERGSPIDLETLCWMPLPDPPSAA